MKSYIKHKNKTNCVRHSNSFTKIRLIEKTMQFVDRTVKRTSFQLVCRDLSIKIYTFTIACIFVRKKKKNSGGLYAAG